MRAVAHAETILSWQENLSKDEMPPEWMWSLDEELGDWFDEVSRARDERFGVTHDEPPEMVRNEFARMRRDG